MDYTDTLTLILTSIATFGLAVLAILGAVVGLALGYLVFKYGWRLLNDRSITLGGYYLRDTPYKGYIRFRSQKWNAKNTM